MSKNELLLGVLILITGCYGVQIAEVEEGDPWPGTAGADGLDVGLLDLDSDTLFEALGQDYGVPADLLKAMAWVESGFAPVDGDHGHSRPGNGWLGLDAEQLARAASATGIDVETLASDRTANLVAGAWLLGDLRTELSPLANQEPDARWWPVLVAWPRLDQEWMNHLYAADVFAALQRGLVAQTAAGDTVQIIARDIPDLAEVQMVLPPGDSGDFSADTDYPGAARFVASPNSSTRAAGINKIVIHTTEGSYAGAISWLTNPASEASAHYVVRKSDGEITQLVRDQRKAWHAGSGNSDSIGIEHEGAAASPSTWTPQLLESSARLSAWLSDSYGIPVDRDHFIGHVEVPGASHTDPGSYFPWTDYLEMVICFKSGGGSACADGSGPAGGSEDGSGSGSDPSPDTGADSDSGSGSGSGDSPVDSTDSDYPWASVQLESPSNGDTVGNPVIIRASRQSGHHIEFWSGPYKLGDDSTANPAHAQQHFLNTGWRSITAKNVSQWGTVLATHTVSVNVADTQLNTLQPFATAAGGLTWRFTATSSVPEVEYVRYSVDSWMLSDDNTGLTRASGDGYPLDYSFEQTGHGRLLLARGYDVHNRLVSEGTMTLDVDYGQLPECRMVGTLSCGQTVSGDTSGPLASDVIDGYPELVGTWHGPEQGWGWTATVSGEVELRFVDPEPTVLDLDIIVLEQSLGTCVAPDVYAWGFTGLTFEVQAGAAYTVVIDGYDGDAGAYELELNCAP